MHVRAASVDHQQDRMSMLFLLCLEARAKTERTKRFLCARCLLGKRWRVRNKRSL